MSVFVDDPVGVTLDESLGTTAAENQGIAKKNGYFFYIYLPGKDRGIGESSHLPEAKAEFADEQEMDFICYAWPIEYGKTGMRTFAVDASGEIGMANYRNPKYSGHWMPAFDAVMGRESDTANQGKKKWRRIRIGIGQDGQMWST